MMKTGLGKLVVAVLLLFVLFSFTCFAQQTLTVPDDYPTIQSAIDAAQPGDTVYVRAGRYTENIIIDKPLSLIGEDRTTTIIRSSDSEQHVITIKLPQGNIDIAGIKVSGGHTGIHMHVFAGIQVMLNDIIVFENRFGVATFGDGSLVVTGSYFVDNYLVGLQLGNATAVVESNEIVRGETGLILVGVVDVKLDGNLIGLCKWGIDTYTKDCGYSQGYESFVGRVSGGGNRVYALSTDVCPEYPGAPWPNGLVDTNWGEAIAEVVDALDRGLALDRIQDHEGALAAFVAGLTLLESVSFPLLEANLNGNIGVVYAGLGWYEEALPVFEAARGVFETHGMEVDVAVVDQNVGNVYAGLGWYEEALFHYEAAREAFEAHGMEVKIAEVDANIGSVYTKIGQYEEALSRYGPAREAFEAHRTEVEVARIDQNIGTVYYLLGRYEEALSRYGAAWEVFEAHGMEVKVADIDTNIGGVYWNLGRYEEALSRYGPAREVFEAHGMEVDVADIDTNIGNVYLNLGRYEEALAAYESVRAVYVDHGMQVDVAEIDQNIGVVYDNLGRYEDALAAYQSARAVYVDRQMDVDVAEIDQNIGVVYDNLGRYEDALAAYQLARAVYVDRQMEVNVANVDVNIGVVYMNLGRYEDALQAYEGALALLDEIPPLPGMVYSHPATRWMLLNNKGICYEGCLEWDQAIEAYEDAIVVIESIRGGFTSEDLKVAWQERTQGVYERLIDLLYWMDEGASAFPYAERCRARTFLDALYQGSISPDQLISPEAGISSGAVDPIAIDQAVADARDSLQPNEAVLEYFVTDDGIYLWVITKEGIGDPIFIKYERAQLMNDVITLRKTLESDPPDPIVLTELLTSFYDTLVKDSLAKLPDEVDTLILIPSGPLWYLPFSALIMTDQELTIGSGATHCPYLVENYTLAYLPSLASLSSLAKGEAQAAEGVRLLALADPELSPDQLRASEGSKCGEEQSLDRYEQLVAACQAFADLLVGEEQEEQCVYAGREAREVRAHVETGRQVVVYAAHGQFNPYVPLQSKLLLASGGEGTNLQTDSRKPDGNYHAWEVLLTDYRGTKLVILAVCESLLPALRQMQGTLAVLANQECDQVELTPQQLEQIVVGDEVVGLARAFLSSGAEAVLGTLWLANPTAIGKLLTSMADYYKNEGDTWVQALTNAQRELIEDNTFKNPWFWAPYQLIGRWR